MSSSKVIFIARHTLTFFPHTKSIPPKPKLKKSKTIIQSKKLKLLFPSSTISTCRTIQFTQVASPLIKRKTVKHLRHFSIKTKKTNSTDKCTDTDEITEINDTDECIDTKIKCYFFKKKKSNEYFED